MKRMSIGGAVTVYCITDDVRSWIDKAPVGLCFALLVLQTEPAGQPSVHFIAHDDHAAVLIPVVQMCDT